jgi:hypothetical protein
MNGNSAAGTFRFAALDERIHIDSADAEALRTVRANFAALTDERCDEAAAPDLHFQIDRRDDGSFALARTGREPMRCIDMADLLYDLEKDITVELQKLRADLLFLHAAAVVLNGRAALIASASGGGKSTTTWALLHQGFSYMSDELSAVDIEAMHVHPYPHALCLKQRPSAYALPAQTIDLGRTMHVPASSFPTSTTSGAVPIGAVFLLKYSRDHADPKITLIGVAEAAARLYVNALNPLAHPLHGLDAVARIAEAVPCYDVAAGDLARTSALIRDTLQSASASLAQ